MIGPVLPAGAVPLLLALEPAFTQPTWNRFIILSAAAAFGVFIVVILLEQACCSVMVIPVVL